MRWERFNRPYKYHSRAQEMMCGHFFSPLDGKRTNAIVIERTEIKNIDINQLDLKSESNGTFV